MDPNDNKQTATLRQEMTDDSGRKVQARSEMDLPNTQLGNLARVYVVVGVIGFVVIGAMSGFFLMLKNSLDAAEANQVYMQKRLDKMWDDMLQSQREAAERYVKSRELTEKRHQETLAKLDRVVVFLDKLIDWIWKGQSAGKAPADRPPPPKMLETK